MYTKKYSPKESLEKIKLFMKYDSKKTLNENRNIVEQLDFRLDSRDIKNEIDKFNSDEDQLIRIIQKYTTKADFQKLVDTYKEYYDVDLGKSLYRAINDNNDPVESKQLKDHLAKLGVGVKWSAEGGKSSWAFDFGSSTPKPTTPKPPSPPKPIPEKLKDAEGVKKFQDWLDQNVTDWAKGYKDGKVNKGQQNPGFKSGGYGSFGPRTSQAWATYKDKYLNKEKQSAEKPSQDEISGEEMVINVADL